MCISGAHLPLNSIIGSLSQEKPLRPVSMPSVKKSKSFNLQIIDSSIKVTSKGQSDSTSIEQQYFTCIMYFNEYRAESFSLPGWSKRWFSDLNVMALDKEMKDMAYHQRQYDALSAKKKDDLNEYTYAVLTCINEKLVYFGIKDRADYARFMQDEELSEEIYQAVTNCLADNPRIIELMHSFGRTLY